MLHSSFEFPSSTRIRPVRSDQEMRSSNSCFHPTSSFFTSFDLSQFSILRLISESKFQVYLVRSKKSGKYYALKLFPHQGNKPHKLFCNEAQYSSLKHPNIIQFISVQIHKEVLSENIRYPVSYILQEYAFYGDLYELATCGIILKEKLVRTLFHQLIEGLSYLHQKNIAHLDIKLENLLVGKDLKLKIADFDLSKPANGVIDELTGSPVYKAPELQNKKYNNLKTSDIYSAGIVLFILKNCGQFPHLGENNPEDSVNLFDKLYNDQKAFWLVHRRINKQPQDFFSSEFKELFLSLVDLDPERRPSVNEIPSFSWYQKEIYTDREFQLEMIKIVSYKKQKVNSQI